MPEFVALVFRFSLGYVFAIAGISKVSEGPGFARAVRNYEVLPQSLVAPVARWLPRLELAGGLLLLMGVLQSAVSSGLAVLLLGLMYGVGVNLVRGRRIDCGCFGSGGAARISWLTIARNLILATMALLLAIYPSVTLAIPSPWESSPAGVVAPGDAVAVAMATISSVVIFQLVGAVARLSSVSGIIKTLVLSGRR